VYPELHKQSVLALLLAGALENAGHEVHTLASRPPILVENLPDAQSEQLPIPEAILYVPATHNVHASPLAVPDDPALQVQSVNVELPAGAPVSAGHS
jgi:hypothetical protein